MQKSRLIEKLAELVNERKLPLVADVRDESAEDVRVVVEPAQPRRRPRCYDGIVVSLERSRNALSRQHERACRWRGAARGVARRRAQAMARSSPRRAAAPLAQTTRGDRASSRRARGHVAGLPQPRRGDPHHPRGGRAERLSDGALRVERRPGELHPGHAAALVAQARRDAAQARARGAREGAGRPLRHACRRTPAVEDHRGADPRHPEALRTGDQARAPPHHLRDAAGRLCGRPRGIAHRQGADHRRRVRQGLDSRAQRSRRRTRRRDPSRATTL